MPLARAARVSNAIQVRSPRAHARRGHGVDPGPAAGPFRQCVDSTNARTRRPAAANIRQKAVLRANARSQGGPPVAVDPVDVDARGTGPRVRACLLSHRSRFCDAGGQHVRPVTGESPDRRARFVARHARRTGAARPPRAASALDARAARRRLRRRVLRHLDGADHHVSERLHALVRARGRQQRSDARHVAGRRRRDRAARDGRQAVRREPAARDRAEPERRSRAADRPDGQEARQPAARGRGARRARGRREPARVDRARSAALSVRGTEGARGDHPRARGAARGRARRWTSRKTSSTAIRRCSGQAP